MILSLIKYGLFVVLSVIGLGQVVSYKMLKRNWGKFRVVAGEILESRILHYTDTEGKTVFEARIRFKYQFQGKEYESETPALRGPQLFPLFDYESKLVQRYKRGEIYNIRVHPLEPEIAYLEVAPLSKISVVVLPFVLLGYLAYLSGIGWYFSLMLGE